MSTTEKRWLSVEEAAFHTGTDPDWIMAHVRSGALKSVITANRKSATGPGKYRRRIDCLKLDALMERLETAAVAEPAPEAASPAKVRPAATAGKETARERLARTRGARG